MTKADIIKLIDAYWKFDDNQQPMSSWHDKQDLLKRLETDPFSHIERHKELHNALDELLADFIKHNKDVLPSKTSILSLIEWSYKETLNPTKP